MDEVQILGPDERDARADTDTGQYYCVTKRGGIVSRDARPLYATLAEWQSVAKAVKGAVYVPITGGKRTEPLFGSLPLWDRGETPDIVGQLVSLISSFEDLAIEGLKRIALLDKIAAKGTEGLENLSLIISQRIHFVELLDRAAPLINPDAGEHPGSYEQRLDWLAKWREVVGR